MDSISPEHSPGQYQSHGEALPATSGELREYPIGLQHTLVEKYYESSMLVSRIAADGVAQKRMNGASAISVAAQSLFLDRRRQAGLRSGLWAVHHTLPRITRTPQLRMLRTLGLSSLKLAFLNANQRIQ